MAGRSVRGRGKDPGLKFIRNKLRPATFLVSQVPHVWCFGGDYLTYETSSSRIFTQHPDEAPCACGRAHKKGRACSAMAYTWGVSCPCCTPRYWAIMRPPYWWRSRLCGFTCVHGRCPLAVSFAFCASFSPGEFFSGGRDLLMLRPPRRVPLCPAAAKCTALDKAAARCPEDWCRSPATRGKRAQPTLRSAVDGHEGRGPKPNHKTKWRKPVRLRTEIETFHPTQDQGAAWRAFRSEGALMQGPRRMPHRNQDVGAVGVYHVQPVPHPQRLQDPAGPPRRPDPFCFARIPVVILRPLADESPALGQSSRPHACRFTEPGRR